MQIISDLEGNFFNLIDVFFPGKLTMAWYERKWKATKKDEQKVAKKDEQKMELVE